MPIPSWARVASTRVPVRMGAATLFLVGALMLSGWLSGVSGYASSQSPDADLAGRAYRVETSTPFGLDTMVDPPDNRATPERIDLGRQLFFDNRLSG